MIRACALGALMFLSSAAVAANPTQITDDFEHGLAKWDVYGENAVFIEDSGDPIHKNVMVLRPQGDVLALVKGTEKWAGERIEGDVLFPTNIDNYVGVAYNFRKTGDRRDFGLIYIKGNDSYLAVNPHHDFNVGRTLYDEYRTKLTGVAAIRTKEWQHFKVEVVGHACHFYVGDMEIPQLTFSVLELTSGAVGLQPRSVGGDVWIDNMIVTPIEKLTYSGPPKPKQIKYAPETLLTQWQVIGPLARTRDNIARHTASRGWRDFATDERGAVVTARIVDYEGPNTVAYFRTRVHADAEREAVLHLSTVDDLAVWVNGRFWWFIPRTNSAWYDFASNPEHKGQRIPITLNAGDNQIVIRVRGGVYASGGFFAALE